MAGADNEPTTAMNAKRREAAKMYDDMKESGKMGVNAAFNELIGQLEQGFDGGAEGACEPQGEHG